ncbi:MAG: FAD:protein FMN transferase [Luminiphilus sp.]|nr:FAD:protein FMN transferase [Luminiphilus sp.]
MARLRPAIVLVVLFLGLQGCAESSNVVELQGRIYGTGWSLVYLQEQALPAPDVVEKAVLAAFDVVNISMNTYDPQSLISAFNAQPAGEGMEVDWDFTYVLNEAMQITRLTGGAYDVTVAPLINLWGFGPGGPTQIPTDAAISAARDVVGLSRLDWQPNIRYLSKRVAGVSLEFSSIAKGYGVDLAADTLDELGIKNFMLEVGGELQLRGHSPRGDAWRIAVERPEQGRGTFQAAVNVSNVGVATSGDYRNYFERDGQRYSHIIDPRTGYPVQHDLVSVTVIHPSTALADAWATALCVLGTDRALDVADRLGLAVYLVYRDADALKAVWSTKFGPFLASNAASG